MSQLTNVIDNLTDELERLREALAAKDAEIARLRATLGDIANKRPLIELSIREGHDAYGDMRRIAKAALNGSPTPDPAEAMRARCEAIARERSAYPMARNIAAANRSPQGQSAMTEIFVFGSNLAGRHGKGAALEAAQRWGAIYGQGVGLQGRSYAIPTKCERLVTLELGRIKFFVDQFISVARHSPHLTFRLTPIGCGLAGYRPEQIAPMFRRAPANVILPPEFIAALKGEGEGK